MNGSTPKSAEIISRATAPIISEKAPPPAAPVYVTGEEFLQLLVVCPVFFSGATVTYTARLLRMDGTITPFSKAFLLASSSTVDSMKLAEGYLLNVNVMISAGAGFTRGEAWVRLNLGRGSVFFADIRATLIQNYMSTQYMAAWPGAPFEYPLDGPGNPRSFTGTNPAAGVESAETVPTNALWRLRGISATLVTDPTVANRFVTFVVTDGTTTIRQFSAGIAQTATQTIVHTPGAGSPGVAIGTTFMIHPFNDDVIMAPTFQIRTLTSGLQAGDNWGAPVILVEEYVFL